MLIVRGPERTRPQQLYVRTRLFDFMSLAVVHPNKHDGLLVCLLYVN
jgi:hypothetical protein